MRLRTQVKQAIQCCVLMAGSPAEALTTSFLSEVCNLPREYLSKTLQALARARMTVSTPGPGGGYQLSRQACDISVREIVEAIEGEMDSFRSKDDMSSSQTPDIRYTILVVGRLFEEADAAWNAVLGATSLEDLARQVEFANARATRPSQAASDEFPTA